MLLTSKMMQDTYLSQQKMRIEPSIRDLSQQFHQQKYVNLIQFESHPDLPSVY